MKEWEKAGYFANRVVYAWGNERKLVIPHSPVIYFDLDSKKVWWNRANSDEKTFTASKRS